MKTLVEDRSRCVPCNRTMAAALGFCVFVKRAVLLGCTFYADASLDQGLCIA